MQYREISKVAHCLACGCDDFNACDEGCWWLEVDRRRGIGVCSSCELEDGVQVFRIGEGVWIAGAGTAQDLVAAYGRRTGQALTDITGAIDASPAKLGLIEMWSTKVGAANRAAPTSHSIAEALKAMIAAQSPLPCRLRHAAE